MSDMRKVACVVCSVAATFGVASALGQQVSRPEAIWMVRAWVVAPGDFPSRSLEATRVRAVNASSAISRATRHFWCCWLSPDVVYVARVRPSWRQQ